MSEADRHKWDERYAAGAYEARTHPSPWLQQQLVHMDSGPALDLACGAGRNALFLARNGFAVDAIDISQVALDRAQARAQQLGVQVNWLCQDLLEAPQIPRHDYALIILFRFVAPNLLPQLKTHLAPGGVLLIEEHLQVTHNQPLLAGPGSARFRVDAGVLRRAADGLSLLYHYAGVSRDPDGRYVALSRLMARAPS